eukprot:TRINITY_DN3346_c0_g1_i3.p1 TRINITY_DN3346_c0_g1~~TRINITY_DN3346_c0_g1_i3.p1  ORF type:complete len:360 (+),score=61.77 TRINITY_DN3346_c0_g1_i3:261-1340(+)
MDDDATITGYANFEGETNEQGKKHGHGKLTWDDGESFEGTFKNDEKVHGTFRWATGDVYEGDWAKDVMDGKGTYYYVDGRKYSGGWECGCRHGVGTFQWPNGDKYEGEFVKDHCHGVGIHTYSDGRQYKGEWLDNKKHGYGVFSYPKGEKTEGFWEHNLLSGRAIYTDTDGKRFEETWKEGARTGARKTLRRDGNTMRELVREGSAAPQWANDSDHPNCFKCGESFSLLNRRHHCRFCGLVFCATCTSEKMKISRGAGSTQVMRHGVGGTSSSSSAGGAGGNQGSQGKPERVCDECLLLIKTSEVLHRITEVLKANNHQYPSSTSTSTVGGGSGSVGGGGAAGAALNSSVSAPGPAGTN